MADASPPGCVYRGVITHARHRPAKHRFAYEIFLFSLDIDRLDELFRGWGWWPLAGVNRAALASFRESDHMKLSQRDGRSLSAIVRDEVLRKTGTRPTGKIQLLTNLAYAGYCFNPISLYYVWSADGSHVETILAEVSNTPWNEMHYYVLNERVKGVVQVSTTQHPAQNGSAAVIAKTAAGNHPSLHRLSPVGVERTEHTAALEAAGAVGPTDVEGLVSIFATAAAAAAASPPSTSPVPSPTSQSSRRRGFGSPAPSAATAAVVPPEEEEQPHAPPKRLRFQWAKAFHVSPFMDMAQTYDWVFSEPGETLLVQSQNRSAPSPQTAPDDADAAKPQLMLHTQLRMVRSPLTPLSLAYLLLWAFPLLTWRVQLLIHYEAFVLWCKSVPLYMHPQGASNTFTRVVEAMMTPLLVIAGWIATRKNNKT